MKVADKATPIGAVLAGLTTLACCMPLGFLGALGLAGFGLWAARYRLVFMALAVVLLAVNFFLVYRGRGSCSTRSKASLIMFWTAMAIVVLVFLFPQLIASLFAIWDYK